MLGALVFAGLRAVEPEPRPIRVTLVPTAGEKPGSPAAAARGTPDAPTPPAKAAPAPPSPKRVVAKPKPPAPRPTPKPVAKERETAATAAQPAAPSVSAAPPSAAPVPGAGEGAAAAGAGMPEGRGGGAGAGTAAEGDGGASRERIARYVEEVRRRIAGLQHYPTAAKLRGVEGVVTVVLAIGPDGRLLDLVLEGDPNALLARSAREATEAAAPFAPPPGGARRIRVPVRYALR